MAVFLYQLGIFIAIQIASAYGKKTRNAAIILITIFTVLQVFAFGLMALQFFTIFIAYCFSRIWFSNKSEKINYQHEPITDINDTSSQQVRKSQSFDLDSHSLEKELDSHSLEKELDRLIDELNY